MNRVIVPKSEEKEICSIFTEIGFENILENALSAKQLDRHSDQGRILEEELLEILYHEVSQAIHELELSGEQFDFFKTLDHELELRGVKKHSRTHDLIEAKATADKTISLRNKLKNLRTMESETIPWPKVAAIMRSSGIHSQIGFFATMAIHRV